jgi:xanthine dehydrogenase YagS FAD-binding subunit
MKRFELAQASTLPQAAQLASKEKTVLKAGGVDLIDLMKEHIAEPDRVVSIRRVSGAGEIREEGPAPGREGSAIVIGPLATLAQLAASPLLRSKARGVAQAAGEAASPQVRNQATAAGNLLQRPRCWYFRKEEIVCRKKGGAECNALDGENRYHAIFGNQRCAIVHPSNLAPPLLLFDASVRTVKPGGEKREIPLAQLFVTPETDVTREHSLEAGEVIDAIVVPMKEGGATSEFQELREKQSFDWPLVTASVRLVLSGKTVQEARIVLGAVAPVPLRREEAEKALTGKTLDEAVAREAAKAAFAGATPLAQNSYKVPAGIAVLTRAILAAGGAGK